MLLHTHHRHTVCPLIVSLRGACARFWNCRDIDTDPARFCYGIALTRLSFIFCCPHVHETLLPVQLCEAVHQRHGWAMASWQHWHSRWAANQAHPLRVSMHAAACCCSTAAAAGAAVPSSSAVGSTGRFRSFVRSGRFTAAAAAAAAAAGLQGCYCSTGPPCALLRCSGDKFLPCVSGVLHAARIFLV
jgi:hypothetical protein